MEFPTDYISEIENLTQRAAETVMGYNSEKSQTETENTLIFLNNLRRRLTMINQSQANPVTSAFFFQEIIKSIESFLENLGKHKSGRSFSKRKEDMIIFQGRLSHFLDSFNNVLYFDRNDLFSLPQTHERWGRLKPFVKFHKFENPENITKSYNKIMKKLTVGQASVADARKTSGKISKFSFGVSAIYYSIFKKSASKRAEVINACPVFEIHKILYDLFETDFVQNHLNYKIPSVNINQIFFIPRTVNHVFESFNYINIDPDIQHSPGDNVGVRFLSNESQFYDSLIIHIHGGGFVAMSSKSHQCYTRRWVRSLGIPCISIDYRLAPEHPFPAALDDAWQVYNWVLSNSESKLNIRPEKIFLMGDSAGGNIALSLSYRIIEQGIKPPTALLLAYPALNLSPNQFTPSIMYCLEDKLVPLSFIKLCIKAYIPPGCSEENYYVSPIRAPLRFIQGLPPIRIATGDKDPMHDENWRFTEKLVDAGADVQFCIFEGLVHAALSFSYQGGIKESEAMIDQFEKWILDFL